MSAKSELQQAHDELLAVLDEKFATVPEWRAYRAVARALRSVSEPQPGALQLLRRGGVTLRKTSYADLAIKAFNEAGRPINTDAIMEAIGRHRSLGDDPRKARINIQSALSKDDRIKSIPWRGGRAWWHAKKPIPVDNESAGLGLTQTPPNTPSA